MRRTDPEAQYRKEWAAWQRVCAVLRETGAVTEADLRSPTTLTKDPTPGQRVFEAIRTWGDELVKLREGM